MLSPEPEIIKDRITMVKGDTFTPQRFWKIIYVEENLVDYFIEEGYYKYKYNGNSTKKS